jgi:hypothetical protein
MPLPPALSSIAAKRLLTNMKKALPEFRQRFLFYSITASPAFLRTLSTPSRQARCVV